MNLTEEDFLIFFLEKNEELRKLGLDLAVSNPTSCLIYKSSSSEVDSVILNRVKDKLSVKWNKTVKKSFLLSLFLPKKITGLHWENLCQNAQTLDDLLLSLQKAKSLCYVNSQQHKA